MACREQTRSWGLGCFLMSEREKKEMDTELMAGRFARKEDLPVNPLVDMPHESMIPEGCTEIVPEVDVMDTWATSSITPLINMNYMGEESLEKTLRPMSIRTNGSDIIRTWDFYTIVKSYYHFNEIPWKDLVVSRICYGKQGRKDK